MRDFSAAFGGSKEGKGNVVALSLSQCSQAGPRPVCILGFVGMHPCRCTPTHIAWRKSSLFFGPELTGQSSVEMLACRS